MRVFLSVTAKPSTVVSSAQARAKNSNYLLTMTTGKLETNIAG